MRSQQAAMDAPTQPSPVADPAADPAPGYIQVLNDFITMGTELAQLVIRQAKAGAEAQEAGTGRAAPDPSIAFERIGRTVRRSIMLADRLAKSAPAPSAQHRITARKRILREVEDVIQRDADDWDAESLEAELLDRLDSPDLADDIDNRPVTEIIAEICRDLGLAAMPGTHPWKRRTPDDVAELCARAARPYRSSASPAPAARAADRRAARSRPDRSAPPRPSPAEPHLTLATTNQADPDGPGPTRPAPAAPDPIRPFTWPKPEPARQASVPAATPPPNPAEVRHGAQLSHGPPWHLGR